MFYYKTWVGEPALLAHVAFPFGGRPDREIAPKGEAREWEWRDGEMPEAVGPKTAQKSGWTRANEWISAAARACCPDL